MGERDKSGKRLGKRAWPLRKIIERNVPGVVNGNEVKEANLLECGHFAYKPTDIYGETSPVSQRCGTCYSGGSKVR